MLIYVVLSRRSLSGQKTVIPTNVQSQCTLCRPEKTRHSKNCNEPKPASGVTANGVPISNRFFTD